MHPLEAVRRSSMGEGEVAGYLAEADLAGNLVVEAEDCSRTAEEVQEPAKSLLVDTRIAKHNQSVRPLFHQNQQLGVIEAFYL